MLRLFEKFVFLFQLHACKLTKLSACIAKCMNFLTIFFNNFFLKSSHRELCFKYSLIGITLEMFLPLEDVCS